MPPTNLKALLQDKPLPEQAAWYRILSRARFTRSGLEQSFPQQARGFCQDYLLPVEDAVLQYAANFRGDRRAWEKELEDLKESLIQSIVASLRRAGPLSQLNAEDLVTWARTLGALLAAELKTAQIRRFLGAVMEAEVEAKKDGPAVFRKTQVEYLRVYLAYAAGRNRAALPLLAVLEPMIGLVRPQGEQGWEDFRELVRFVRSIVAYHKFFGGAE